MKVKQLFVHTEIIVLFFLVFLTFPAYSQNKKQAEKRPDIFIAPVAEVLGYSRDGVAFGGGVALGVEDTGTAMGLRFLYASDIDSMKTMELTVLIRFYLFNQDEHTGLFLQANGGASLLSIKNEDDIQNEEVGTF